MPDLKRKLYFAGIPLLVLLAGAFYWYSSLERDQVQTSRWLSSLEEVKTVHVQTAKGTYSLIASKGKQWEAQVPGISWNIAAKGVRGRVSEYLTRLEKLVPLRSFSGPAADEFIEYGLDNPGLKIILQFDKKNAQSLTIRFFPGQSGRVYGWNSESPDLVYEFDEKVFEQFSYPAIHFLDTRVFQFDEEGVNQLQLVQPFGSSWLVKRQKKGFVFTLPGYLKDEAVSDSEIRLYIHALALLRAGKLLLEPILTEKEMAALTIKIWTEGSNEPSMVEFFSIEEDPKHYLGKSSWLTVPFLLDAESVGQLAKSAFDVQERNIVTLDIGQVAKIIIDHGSKQYILKRDDSGWRVVGGEKDVPGIDMALWRFTELQFEALPLNNLSTTAVQLMRCQFRDIDGELLKKMIFYADPKLPQGQCWMKDGDGMFYPVSSRLLKDLQGMFPAGATGNKG
ncbi:DUF4340 domain-containing protein [Pseudodesulfovibrio sp. S3]|nr:DUF4340 domain-containing protein [Pseudodesulfovibrio sp. S3]